MTILGPYRHPTEVEPDIEPPKPKPFALRPWKVPYFWKMMGDLLLVLVWVAYGFLNTDSPIWFGPLNVMLWSIVLLADTLAYRRERQHMLALYRRADELDQKVADLPKRWSKEKLRIAKKVNMPIGRLEVAIQSTSTTTGKRQSNRIVIRGE